MGRSRNDSPLMADFNIGITAITLYRTKSGPARLIQYTT